MEPAKVDPYHKRYCQTCQKYQPADAGTKILTAIGTRRWRCNKCTEKINRRVRHD